MHAQHSTAGDHFTKSQGTEKVGAALAITPKQRVLAAIHHQELDRVPTGENDVDYLIAEKILGRPTLYNSRWKERLALWDGRRDEIVADYGSSLVELAQKLEWDYVRVPIMPVAKRYRRPEMTGEFSWIDDDGREFEYSPNVGNIATQVYKTEIAISDLPDPSVPFHVSPSELDAIRHVVKELGKTHFIIGRSAIDGTFPYLETVGMEEFLLRMVLEPEFVKRAIDVYVARSIAYFEAMLDAGCDAVMTTDDYCDNTGPIMGPQRFREFILPGLVRQVEAVHARGGYFIKHTDGNTWDILDALVEAKVDGWHGIQPRIGMDLRRLKERFGGKLCFFGGINCETLIEGPPERAREDVRYAIKHSGRGGGLVITTGNVLQSGTDLDNYLAARQATREYGTYPIALEV